MSASVKIKQVFSQYKVLTLIIAIAVIWAYFGFRSDTFLSARNFSNLLRQTAVTTILASGMIFIIISGEIDLSVGSLLGLLGALAATLDVTYHFPFYATVPIVLFAGLLLGLYNGAWVAYLRVPSFIVGLAGMEIFRGILGGVTSGGTISGISESFIAFGQTNTPKMLGYLIAWALFVLLAVMTFRSRANRVKYNLAVAPFWQELSKLAAVGAVIGGFVWVLNKDQGIPLPILIALSIVGLFTFIGNNTVFGRRIYAVGSNLEATRLSGVNVQMVKMWIFGLMGVMCALGGLIYTARIASASSTAGDKCELDAIASCFIGGASMRGGSGTVYGALIGALIMTSLNNGMSLLGTDTFWQMIIRGGILLLAVWVDVLTGSER